MPDSFYLCNKKQEASTADDNGNIYLHLLARSKEVIEFHVGSPESKLWYIICSLHEDSIFFLSFKKMFNSFGISWEFYSKNGDVVFAIYYKDGDKMIPMVPQKRINCHIATEKGEIICHQTGLCNDNLHISNSLK